MISGDHRDFHFLEIKTKKIRLRKNVTKIYHNLAYQNNLENSDQVGVNLPDGHAYSLFNFCLFIFAEK